MTAGGNKFNACQCDSQLTDPNFTVDSHGGYCVVRIKDSWTYRRYHDWLRNS